MSVGFFLSINGGVCWTFSSQLCSFNAPNFKIQCYKRKMVILFFTVTNELLTRWANPHSILQTGTYSVWLGAPKDYNLNKCCNSAKWFRTH